MSINALNSTDNSAATLLNFSNNNTAANPPQTSLVQLVGANNIVVHKKKKKKDDNDPDDTAQQLQALINSINAAPQGGGGVNIIQQILSSPSTGQAAIGLSSSMLFTLLGPYLFRDLIPNLTSVQQPKNQSTQVLIQNILTAQRGDTNNYKSMIEAARTRLEANYSIANDPKAKKLLDYLLKLGYTPEQRQKLILETDKLQRFKDACIMTLTYLILNKDLDGTVCFKNLAISNNAHILASLSSFLDKTLGAHFINDAEAIIKKVAQYYGINSSDINVIKPIIAKEVLQMLEPELKKYTDFQTKSIVNQLALVRIKYILKGNIYDNNKVLEGNEKSATVEEIVLKWNASAYSKLRTIEEALQTADPRYRYVLENHVQTSPAEIGLTARIGTHTNQVTSILPSDLTVSNEHQRILAALGGYREELGLVGVTNSEFFESNFGIRGVGGLLNEMTNAKGEQTIVLPDASLLDDSEGLERILNEGRLKDLAYLGSSIKTVEAKGPPRYIFNVFRNLIKMAKNEYGGNYEAGLELSRKYSDAIAELTGEAITQACEYLAQTAKKELGNGFISNEKFNAKIKSLKSSQGFKDKLHSIKETLLRRLDKFKQDYIVIDEKQKLIFVKPPSGKDFLIPIPVADYEWLKNSRFDSFDDLVSLRQRLYSAAPISMVVHAPGPNHSEHFNKAVSAEGKNFYMASGLFKTFQEWDKKSLETPEIQAILKSLGKDCLFQSTMGLPEELQFNADKKNPLFKIAYNGLLIYNLDKNEGPQNSVTYCEFVLKELAKHFSFHPELFADYLTITYGDSPADIVAIVKRLMADPTAGGVKVRHITTRANVIKESPKMFNVELIEKGVQQWLASHQKHLERIYWDTIASEDTEPTETIEALNKQLFARIAYETISGGKIRIKEAGENLTKQEKEAGISFASGFLQGKVFNSEKDFKIFLSKLVSNVRDLHKNCMAPYYSCPVAYKINKDKTVEIVGENILKGKKFKDETAYKDFIFKEGGWFDQLFGNRIVSADEVDHNVRMDMITSARLANANMEAVEELIDNPQLLLDKTAPHLREYTLGPNHLYVDNPSELNLHLSEQKGALYGLQNALRLKLPLFTHRVIAGSALGGISGAAVLAAMFLYKTLTEHEAPEHTPSLMGELKPPFNKTTSKAKPNSKNKQMEKLLSALNDFISTDPKKDDKAHKTQLANLIATIQNVGSSMITGGYLGMNIGFLLKNLFMSPMRQSTGVLGNLAALALIFIPPQQIALQRATILGSIALNMLAWANRLFYEGQLDVKFPMHPKEFTESLQSESKFETANKSFNKIGGKPYFAAAEYQEIYAGGRQLEEKLIKRGVPSFLANLGASGRNVSVAVWKTLKDFKYFKDMLLNFSPQQEITRGQIINKETKNNIVPFHRRVIDKVLSPIPMPHGVGFAVAWGAFIPIVALIGGSVAEIAKFALNKNKKDKNDDAQNVFNHPAQDPLMVSTALSATIPGIANATFAPVIRIAGQGDPLTSAIIGANKKAFNQMPNLNANLLAVGGLTSAAFSVLTLLPGNLGHLFSALFDISAFSSSLGSANNDMSSASANTLTTGIVQKSLAPTTIHEHSMEIAKAKAKGTDKWFNYFPQEKGSLHNNSTGSLNSNYSRPKAAVA